MRVKIKKFAPEAQLPKKAHEKDFCYDVYALDDGIPLKNKDGDEVPNAWVYRTGIGFEIVRGDTMVGQNPFYRPQNFMEDPNLYFDFEKSPINIDIDIRPRSSICKTGLILANSEATIDEPYTGEVKFVFYHVIPTLPRYKKGDRIGQAKLGFTLPMEFIEVDNLTETDRGEGGFGSTGK